MSENKNELAVQDIDIIAKRIADSRLFGLDQAQAFCLMLMAQAEGLPYIKAVQRYHVISGKPAMKSDAMLADFQKAKGTVEWLTESDDKQKCEAVFRHPMHAPQGKTIRFSMEDAKTAKLDTKDVWKQYPASMMRARVISIGIRMIMPGIVAGLYTPEEVTDFAPVIDVTPVVPEHHAVNHNNDTGHGSGAYAPPDVVEAYQSFVLATVEEVNQKWLDHITDKDTGEVLRDAPGEIISTWELSGHLLKWARSMDWVRAPLDIRSGQRDKFAAVPWQDHMAEFMEEARLKCRKCWSDARSEMRKKAAKAASAKGKRESPEVLELQAQDEVIDDLLTTEAGARG